VIPKLAVLTASSALLAGGALSLAGCGSAGSAGPGGASGLIQVVAVESFWGSLASQLGGSHVSVTSIVSDPNADPHEYESSPADARVMAKADYVIVNGAGYDDWARKLLEAQPSPRRKVLTVADLLKKKDGDNPHFWYGPQYVAKVISKISSDYESLDPKDASSFTSRYHSVESDLAPYRQRIAYVQQHFARTPVAATESIFQYMAQYLKLDLVTPYPFMEAVAEGNDPPSSAEATFESQIQKKDFKVLVYNEQTVTPLTTSVRTQTAQEGVPVVAVSETLEPPGATFERWMDGELDSLIKALNANTVRG
jgi:zinc/manganese transport system substrate-binding protein